MAFDVSTTDIESRWRVLSDDEADVAVVRLRDAGVRLRTARPGIEARIAALPTTTPTQVALKSDVVETVRAVLAEAVIRYLRNPDVNQRQDIGADGSVGISYDNSALGGVYLTADELALVDAALGAAGGAAPRAVGSARLRSTFPYRTAANSPSTLPLV